MRLKIFFTSLCSVSYELRQVLTGLQNIWRLDIPVSGWEASVGRGRRVRAEAQPAKGQEKTGVKGPEMEMVQILELLSSFPSV